MAEVTGTNTSASDLQMDFLNLLVTQLQNQDPLSPMDSENMSAQLAQFSELQQLEEMNNSFGQMLESVQRSYAGSLIGKDVSRRHRVDRRRSECQPGGCAIGSGLRNKSAFSILGDR